MVNFREKDHPSYPRQFVAQNARVSVSLANKTHCCRLCRCCVSLLYSLHSLSMSGGIIINRADQLSTNILYGVSNREVTQCGNIVLCIFLYSPDGLSSPNA